MFYQREAEHEEEPEEDFVSFEDGSDEDSDGQESQDEVSITLLSISMWNVFFLFCNFVLFEC